MTLKNNIKMTNADTHKMYASYNLVLEHASRKWLPAALAKSEGTLASGRFRNLV
jgi:hypothetical protein